MTIVNTIDRVYELEQEFKRFGRENNFTCQGLKLLFDYLDENHSDDNPYILDIIALCCEYSDDTLDDIISNYSIDVDLDSCIDDQDEDEVEEIKREAVREYLENNTIIVGEHDSGFVYAVF